MSKKKKHNRPNPAPQERVSQPQKTEPASKSSSTTNNPQSEKSSYRLLFNVVALFFAFIFIKTIFKPVDQSNADAFYIGYSWLYNSLIKGNLEIIEKNKNASLRERYYLKWGEEEPKYIFSIQDSTKSTDVLAFPPNYILDQVQFKNMKSLANNAFFQYPRKVYNIDSGATNLPKDVTKVISINGWGLNYNVDTPSKLEGFMILTKKR